MKRTKKTRIRKKARRKLKKWVYKLIAIILLIGFIYCSYKFIRLVVNYYQTKSLIEDLQEDVSINVPVDTDDESEESDYTIDFTNLKETNSDTVGWLVVEDTDINYPVVQTKNNEYYLTHSFDKSYNANGWIFLNYISNSDFSDKNSVIFAHSTLFKSLKSLYNSETKKDITMTLYLESMVVTYKVFSIYVTENYNVSILKNNFSEEEIEEIVKKSKFDYGINVSADDNVLTLSTCYTDSSQRVIIHAKKM